MSKASNIINVMVGNPSDVNLLAERVLAVVNKCSTQFSISHNLALVPHHWTTSTHPSAFNDAQSSINLQLVKECDLMIAIFGSKVGTPTKNNDYGGTAEEIEEHLRLGHEVMVYFSSTVSANLLPDDFNRYHNFRNLLRNRMYTFDYENTDDLEKKVEQSLNSYVLNNIKTRYNGPSSNTNDTVPIKLTNEEYQILSDWCNSKNDLGWYNLFYGGALFTFGKWKFESRDSKEIAKYKALYKKYESMGFAELCGYTRQGNPKYQLTPDAFNYCEGN